MQLTWWVHIQESAKHLLTPRLNQTRAFILVQILSDSFRPFQVLSILPTILADSLRALTRAHSLQLDRREISWTRLTLLISSRPRRRVTSSRPPTLAHFIRAQIQVVSSLVFQLAISLQLRRLARSILLRILPGLSQRHKLAVFNHCPFLACRFLAW